MKKGGAKEECVSLWWADLVCQPGAIQRLSPYPSPRWKSVWVEVNTESTSQLLTIGKTQQRKLIYCRKQAKNKTPPPPFFSPFNHSFCPSVPDSLYPSPHPLGCYGVSPEQFFPQPLPPHAFALWLLSTGCSPSG